MKIQAVMLCQRRFTKIYEGRDCCKLNIRQFSLDAIFQGTELTDLEGFVAAAIFGFQNGFMSQQYSFDNRGIIELLNIYF